MTRFRRRLAKAAAKQLDHAEAAQFMRRLHYAGVENEIVLPLAERALATATPETRDEYALQKWVDLLRAGRKVHRKVTEIIPDADTDAELERAVDEAMTGWDAL